MTGDNPSGPGASLDDLPAVRRYNPWGQWKPIMFPTLDALHAFEKESQEAAADPDLKAALAYARGTGHSGIEFVLLSSHWDESRYQTYGSGITLVRLWDPPTFQPSLPDLACVYDGWIPVEDTSIPELRAALRALQDVVDFLAYQYGVPARTFVKYRECYDLASRRETGKEDDAHFRDRLSRLHDLPESLRTAVLRCTHWHQNAERQPRTSDRFLSYWLALESLALVIYTSARLINLQIAGEQLGQTKRQRKAAQDDRVEQLLVEHACDPASERVTKAYFDGVKQLRRRVEAALGAVLGDDERIAWLYQRNGPAQMRSKLVHEGWSEVDVAHACDLADYCRILDRLIKDLVERVLLRAWATPVEPRLKSYTMTMDVMNSIPAGTGWTAQGDFSISVPLLARKRVLRF